MRTTIISVLACFCMVLGTTAQDFKKGSISLADGSVKTGKVQVDYQYNRVTLKADNGDSQYPFDQVIGIKQGSRSYQKMVFEDQIRYGHLLTAGKASLYEITRWDFGVLMEDGTSKLLDTKEGQAQLPGLLSVLFSDCGAIRDRLKYEGNFDRRNLASVTEQYNTCDYGAGYTPTEAEVKDAESEDLIDVYVGVGPGFSQVGFFDGSETDSATSFGFDVGILITPSFVGPLQGNLFFGLEGSFNFTGDTDYNSAPAPINYSLNAYRALLFTQYHFNKKGSFQPYIGFGIGFTGDYFKGSYNGDAFKIRGDGNVLWNPRAGVLFNLNEKHSIGLTVSYIPEYDNRLSFPAEEELIPLNSQTETIQTRVAFYF